MENLFVKQLMVGPMMNYAYIIGDKSAKEAALIDPGWEADRLVAELKKEGMELKKILVTHTHFDHVNDVPTISDKTGVEIYVHSAEAERFADLPNVKSISAGDKIPLGSFLIGVIYTPGHSKGSVSFTLDDAIFTGDTLFVDGIGRTDLEGGDTEEMFKSLRKLSELPGKVIVYPGHHYGPSPTATIAEQKETNPYLKCRSLSDFFRIA